MEKDRLKNPRIKSVTLRTPGKSRKWPQLVYTLETLPGEDRQRRTVTLKCSLAQAEKEFAKVRDAVAANPYAAEHLPGYGAGDDKPLMYLDFVARYLSRVYYERKSGTYALKDIAFKKFYGSVVRTAYRNDVPVKEISSHEVDLFIQKLQTSLTKDGRRFKAASINTYLRHLRAGFSYLKDAGHIENNPFDGKKVQGPKKGKAEKAPYFTDKQIQEILSALQQDKSRPGWHLAAVRFSLLTGCRVGGIINANANKVFQDAEGDYFIELEEKGSKTRDIPLPREAVELIHQRQLEMFHPVEVINRNAPGRPAGPYVKRAKEGFLFFEVTEANSVTRMFTRLMNALQMEGTFHWLRHTYATRALERGQDIYRLSKILGHSRVDVTEQHYGHITRRALKEGVDLFTSSGFVPDPGARVTPGEDSELNRSAEGE